MSNFGSKTPSGNSRLYNCLKCNKAFTRDEHLTRHILSTHNKLKPFICGICNRPFSRRDLLLRHAKNLHQGSEKSINRLRKSKKFMESSSNGTDADVETEEEGGSMASDSSSGNESTSPSSTTSSTGNRLVAPQKAASTPDKMSVKMLLT